MMDRKKMRDKLGHLDKKLKMSLESQITFGKYKGWSIEAIIQVNPSYISWLISENLVELDNETYSEYMYQLESQGDRQYREDKS